MTDARQNLVVLGTGMIASGKSKLLADRYVARQPRVVHIDTNDEIRTPGAIRVRGLSQLYDVLRIAHEKQARRFTIAAVALEGAELVQLFADLTPASGPADSLAAAFGSLTVECGEMGALCQIYPKVGDALAVAVMRARHHGLSLLMATQYPYSLPPAVRFNAREIFFFQQRDAQALIWARQIVGAEGAEAVRALRDYSFLLYEVESGRLFLCDKSRRVVRTLHEGAAPPAPAPPAPRRAPRPLTRPEG